MAISVLPCSRRWANRLMDGKPATDTLPKAIVMLRDSEMMSNDMTNDMATDRLVDRRLDAHTLPEMIKVLSGDMTVNLMAVNTGETKLIYVLQRTLEMMSDITTNDMAAMSLATAPRKVYEMKSWNAVLWRWAAWA